MITDFRELDKPCHDKDSNIAGAEWYVDVKSTEPYYLLNNGSYDIADLSAGLKHKEFCFDTEADCHEHAAGYYEKHGFSYPYLKEWSDCVPDIDDGDVPDDSGSQVMEFM